MHHVVAAHLGEVVSQLRVVGQIPVEAQGEPLERAAVVTGEGLGVLDLVATAGCIPNVTDGGHSSALVDDRFRLGQVGQAEHLAHGSGVLVSQKPVRPVRVKSCHSGGELPAVLQIEQRRRDEGRDGPLARGHAH